MMWIENRRVNILAISDCADAAWIFFFFSLEFPKNVQLFESQLYQKNNND